MRNRLIISMGLGALGLLAALVIAFTSAIGASAASSPIALGTAANFSVLGGTTVTSVPTSTMNAELGLSPGSSVTGAPTAPAKHIDDGVAVQAKTDLTAAYTQAANEPTHTTIPDAGDIGGETLTPGVYASASSIFLTGNVTLNGPGVYVFKAGSTLITASNSTVTLENGADACDVFWQVGSSETLGTGSRFVGTTMALTSIADDGGSHVDGRLLARNGAVTLNMTTINTEPCQGSSTTTTTTAPLTTTTAPSPPAATTTINRTTTEPCGCKTPTTPPKPSRPVTHKPVVVPPGQTVTVTLPAPGCGCIVVPGAQRPPVVKYVITHIDKKHCHATINQRTGKLKVKVNNPGKYKIVLKRGKQVVTVPVTCKPAAKKK